MRVIDYGSGVTFFPFTIAKLGCYVKCFDIDPICENDLNRAISSVSHNPGKVDFSLIRNGSLTLEKNEVDVVYCISVLEHIPDFENSIIEIARVLKPGGLFVLTIDLDLCGYQDISVSRYRNMRECLRTYFDLEANEVSTHPLNMLLQYPNVSLTKKIKYYLKQVVRRIEGKRFFNKYPNLAVWGGVFRKR